MTNFLESILESLIQEMRKYNCYPDSCSFSHSYCVLEKVGISCRCHIGYQPNEYGDECIDYDECSMNSTCNVNATCINRDGDYYCKCKDGFVDRHGNGSVCSDVDECLHDRPCINTPNSTCVNTPGSFSCDCRDGFAIDNVNQNIHGLCIDIDECSIRVHLLFIMTHH